MQLRTLHRTSAVVLSIYVLLHIGNHLTSLYSVKLHITVMDAMRLVYRQPVVEAILLVCASFQIGSGLWLALRNRKHRIGAVAWLQATSGMYVAFFLLVHVTAVLSGRWVLQLDTNFFFAAAGLHVQPYQWFFAPYYFMAVVAVFAHIACAAYWHLLASSQARAKSVLVIALSVGVLLSALITFSLAGMITSFTVPAEYKATYGAN